jgi:hypothetical protein
VHLIQVCDGSARPGYQLAFLFEIRTQQRRDLAARTAGGVLAWSYCCLAGQRSMLAAAR